MSEYIFDTIDSDKTRRYVYAEYIDKAFRNFIVTLQYIYKCIKGEEFQYVKDSSIQDYQKYQDKFILDDLVNAEEINQCNNLLVKHFPFLKVIEKDFGNSNQRNIIKTSWFFLKALQKASINNVATDDTYFKRNKPIILKWLRSHFGNIKGAKDIGIAIAAKQNLKNKFYLSWEPKAVNFFLNNCTSSFSFRSFVVFVSLFAESKDTYLFITHKDIRNNFYYVEANRKAVKSNEKTIVVKREFKSDDYTNLNRALSIFNIHLPDAKNHFQTDNTNLGLEIINELQKCPHELFVHLSKDDQYKFSIQLGEQADYPDDILLKRDCDRFANFVLQYIDSQKIFKSIRFQVSLGQYCYAFNTQPSIDSDNHERVVFLQKELKTFGRLEDIEQKRKNEWRNILRASNGIVDTAETKPYITNQSTQYIINQQTPKIPLWWDGDCELPMTESDVKQGKRRIKSIEPKAFLSVYDLPALMFLHFLGGNPEKLIKKYYNNYINLFTDIKNGLLTPDNYTKDGLWEKYAIKQRDIPQKIQDYLYGNYSNPRKKKSEESFVRNYQRAKKFEISQRIQNISTKPQTVHPGRMANYLCKSIVYLLKDDEKKPSGVNYSVILANLAVYEGLDKIAKMFERAQITSNHPFLLDIIRRKPKDLLTFYEMYLREEYYFYNDVNNLKYLKVYKSYIKRNEQKNSNYFIDLANKYLSNGFVELTNSIFEDEIRARLSDEIEGIDTFDRKYNISFLISRYYKDSQPFYNFNRDYKIAKLNGKNEPKEKIVFFKQEKEKNEKAINRYRIQDKILFEMAKKLLSASDLKLSNVMHGNSVFDNQMLKWKTSKIHKITFKNYQSIDDFTINCSDYQWTVLLGNNNSGKTSLLRGIVRGLYKSEYNDIINENTLKAWNPLKIQLPYNDSTFIYEFTDNNIANPLFAYGVSRYPSGTEISGNKSHSSGDCDSLFSPHNKLLNIEEWLIRLDYNALKNTTEKDKYDKIRRLICSELFPEISDIECKSDRDLNPYVSYKTPDGWFRYEQLGFGYQSMLSWVVDLGKRLFEKYPNSDNPFKENAVVLVDEIDLHLHPEWQRKVIATVSRVFPNVQFIVTTHSPLVIQSMENVNLYVLRREGDRIVAEHPSITNFSGWTVEEILRDLMNLEDDIRSDVYQKKYKEFTDSLDAKDKARAKAAYETLIQILHPESASRSILELQLELLLEDD